MPDPRPSNTEAEGARVHRLYRKKPLTITAVRNTGEWKPIMNWIDYVAGGVFRVPLRGRPAITRNDDGSLNIETLEGTMRADVGDWVICGVKGELYPCKPGIFEATYEPAPPSTEETDHE